MAILYTNIRKDCSLDFNSEYKPYSKGELLSEFEKHSLRNGFSKVEWTDKKESPYKCNVISKEKTFTLFMYLKNISGAGWENKPWIKRVQVPNIRHHNPEYYVSTNAKQTMVIIGYYNYDDNPLFVAWDAYDYVMHSTVRSCYVEVDDLLRGYEEEYFSGECSKQRIWVFKPEYLRRFLNEYISLNSTEE